MAKENKGGRGKSEEVWKRWGEGARNMWRGEGSKNNGDWFFFICTVFNFLIYFNLKNGKKESNKNLFDLKRRWIPIYFKIMKKSKLWTYMMVKTGLNLRRLEKVRSREGKRWRRRKSQLHFSSLCYICTSWSCNILLVLYELCHSVRSSFLLSFLSQLCLW